MFFKGIKIYFLFLVCLFSVNSVLKCPLGEKRSVKSSSVEPYYNPDLSAKEAARLTAKGYSPFDEQRPVKYSSSTSGRTSPKSPQVVSSSKTKKTQEELEAEQYNREMAAYNEKKEIELQTRAFYQAQQEEALKQATNARTAGEILAKSSSLESFQRRRTAINELTPGDLDKIGGNPGSVHQVTMARKNAAKLAEKAYLNSIEDELYDLNDKSFLTPEESKRQAMLEEIKDFMSTQED